MRRFVCYIILCMMLCTVACPWKAYTQTSVVAHYDLSAVEGVEPLQAQWAFYWQRWLTTAQAYTQKPDAYIQLPDDWHKHGFSSFGYATYYLRLELPADTVSWVIEMPNVASAYQLWVNDSLVAAGGKPAKRRSDEVPDYRRRWITLPKPSGKYLDLILQVSNFHYNRSGVYLPIFVGKAESMKKKYTQTRLWEAFELGGLLMIALYHISLYFFATYHRLAILYFAIACLAVALRLMVVNVGSQLFLDFYPSAGFLLLLRAEYILGLVALILALLFVRNLFREEININIENLLMTFLLAIVLVSLLTPAYIFGYTMPVLYLVLLSVYVYALYVCYRAWARGRSGAVWNLLAFIVLIVGVSAEVFFYLGWLRMAYANTGAISMFMFLVLQSFALAQIFGDTLQEKAQLSSTLEKRVRERTIELELQQEYMKQLNQSMLDSINYAQRIQEAVLPCQEDLQSLFQDAFVLYIPKALVSGDFYWLYQSDRYIWLAVGDCTGHGVPGAFMSLLANNALDAVITHQADEDPARILEMLDQHMRKQLGQSAQVRRQGESYDGMVLALCRFDKQTSSLVFAGAERPLWLIRQGQLQQWQTSRDLIAGYAYAEKRFESIELLLQEGDRLYLFSDGFIDQFHSEHKKKFSQRRFAELLVDISRYNMQEQKDILYATFERWRGQSPQIDDVIVVGIAI